MLTPVILAAGDSRRMKTPKPFIRMGDKTFIEIIAENIRAAGIMNEGFIVFNKKHRSLVGTISLPGFTLIPNERQELGQIYSLQLALSRLHSETTGVLVCLVDHPIVRKETYRLLSDAHVLYPQKVLIPTCGNRRGHPILLPRPLCDEILASPPLLPEGLQTILRAHPGMIHELQTDDSGILTDMDTPDDLLRHINSETLSI